MGNKWNLGQNLCFSNKLWNSTSFLSILPLKCVYQFSTMMELDVGHMTVHTWGNGSNDKNSYSWFSWTVLIYVHCHSKKK